MLKIGEFSKLSRVPVKTLRYYDQIALFQPTDVDKFTGYRYYSLDQLTNLNTILALKDLGFSLEQITRMLGEDLPTEQIRGMLRMKHAEIEQTVDEERARLARVETRLRQIEEGKMPNYEVVLKETEAFRAATLRDTLPNYGSLGELFGEILGELGKQRISPEGPPVTLYYDEEYKESNVDMEIAMPIGGAAFKETSRVKVREEPAVEVASLVRRGPYNDFGPAYQTLMGWIQENGFKVCGPNREIYLRGPADNVKKEDYLTEIQFEVKKAE